MRYALNSKKEKIEVTYSKETAKCEICNIDVNGRKGEVNIKHWAHKVKPDCDNWYEPISDWHLTWQNQFPKKNREVVLIQNGKKHRADILLDNKIVIEIQNSTIPIKQIKQREDFYGCHKMLWILNGESLTTKSIINTKHYKHLYSFTIIFPDNISNNPNYLSKDFTKEVLNIELLNHYKNSELIMEFNIQENKMTFKSLDDIFQLHSDELIRLRYYIVNLYQYFFKLDEVAEFHDNLDFKSDFEEINLTKYKLIKKYWRKFIDQMTYPVFIDNLKGLEENELFWYQENKVIDKDKFIKKYLEYTKTGNNIGYQQIAGIQVKSVILDTK